MIDKKVVEKIIVKNRELKSKKDYMDIKNVSVEELKWSKELLELRDFIANLSNEEMADLLALMECGRYLYQVANRRINKNEFIKNQQNFLMQIKTDEDKKHKATYLLQNSFLSEYLESSLQLFEDANN